MKIKNEVFSNGTWDALATLGQTNNLPFKASWDIGRTIRKMKDGFEVYTETKNKIITKYGKKDEKTGELRIEDKDTENMKKFNDEHKPLKEAEAEYDISKATLLVKEMEARKVSVKPVVLALLGDFIEVK